LRRLAVIVGAIFGLGLAFAAGWTAAIFTDGPRQAERRFKADCELAAPVLADPAFRRLEPFDFPVNGFSLGGPVATRAEYNRLQAEMARLFGEPRVGHIVADVWVETGAEPGPAADRAGGR
jgi:hypothetical protein